MMSADGRPARDVMLGISFFGYLDDRLALNVQAERIKFLPNHVAGQSA